MFFLISFLKCEVSEPFSGPQVGCFNLLGALKAASPALEYVRGTIKRPLSADQRVVAAVQLISVPVIYSGVRSFWA